MAKFREGQYVYILENNRWIRKDTVISYTGGFYTLAILEGGLTRLREHRVYGSEEEANEAMPKPEPKVSAIPTANTQRRTHHFYT